MNESPEEFQTNIPEPMVAPEPPTVPVEQPKPATHKGLLITVISLGVLLMAALGTILYLVLARPATTTVSTTTETTISDTAADETLTAAELIEKVRTSLYDSLSSTYPAMQVESSTDTPAYKSPDVYYAVSGEIGSGLRVSSGGEYNSDAAAKISNAAQAAIRGAANFSEKTYDWMIEFQNDTLICSVETNGSPLGIRCADIASYASIIEAVAPYAEAYMVSDEAKQYGYSDTSFWVSDIVVREAKDGYKTTSISMGTTTSEVGGYAGLFYYDTTKWVYWKGTQSILSCSEYNTLALQKAYEGEGCWDDATEANGTVKVTLE